MNTYQLLLHSLGTTRGVYRGSAADDTDMYSHLSTVEDTLAAVRATADIEIIENGESRWIEYRAGRRVY